MSKIGKIYLLSIIILLGFGLSITYHFYFGYVKSQPYPYTTFLFRPEARFYDYEDVIRDSKTLDPYLEFKSAQYPFLVILGYLFSLISIGGYGIYLVLVMTMIVFLSLQILRGKYWYSYAIPVLIISLLNYPFLFAVDRGNFESLLFVFLLLFIFFYSKGYYSISAMFLACAISMKIFPAILVLLFISEKRVRPIVTCLVSTAVITFASLSCFKGGLLPNLTFLLHGSNVTSNSIFNNFISINSSTVQRGVSLLTLIKIYYIETNRLPGFIVEHFSFLYMALAVILAGIVVLYVIFIEKETWKKATLLIFAMLLLPSISADYKLLHVYIR